jgi:hypothetical protein
MNSPILPATPNRNYGYDVNDSLASYGFNPVFHVVKSTPVGERCPLAKYRNHNGVYLYILMDDVATCECTEEVFVEADIPNLSDEEIELLRMKQGKFSGIVIEESKSGYPNRVSVLQYQDDGNAKSASYVAPNQRDGIITKHIYPLFTLTELRPNISNINDIIDRYWSERNTELANTAIHNLSVMSQNIMILANQIKSYYEDSVTELNNVKSMYSNPSKYVGTVDLQGKLHKIIELANELADSDKIIHNMSSVCAKLHDNLLSNS